MNKTLIESILKEELLVAKLNQDILREHKKLVAERQDWYSLVAEEYMKLEKGADFDTSIIEEGIWSKIKYYMGKAGSLEKGGKIFGRTKRTQAAAEKLEAAIAKAAEKGFGNFRNNIEKDYPEFPNMESKEDFMNALQDMGAVYDSLDAAVAKGGIDPVSANALVEALREYVSFLLDFKLADSYKHFNEGQESEDELDEVVGGVTSTKAPTRRTPNRTGKAGGGGAPEDPDAPKGKFTKRGAQGDAVDSATLKGLASNKLPAILGLTGAAATLAGLLVQSPWAIALLTKAKAGGTAAAGPVKTLTTSLTPKSGEGFTQMLGRITQGNPAHFSPSTAPADLFKAMSDIGINPNNPAELFQLGVDPAAYKAAIATKAGTIGQMFPASNKALFLTKGASAVATLTKALGAATAGTGAAAVTAGTMAAAGTLATTLGIGLVAAGAAVKLIRMKGQKSSRAQLLQDLSKELQPFEVPDGLSAIKPDPDVTPAPDSEQKPDAPPSDEADQEEGGPPGQEEKPEEPGEPQVIKVPVLVRFDDDDIKYYRLNNNKLRNPQQRKEADQILTNLEKKTLIGRKALEEDMAFSEMFEEVEESTILEISTDEFENKFGRGSRAADIRSLKRKNRPRKRKNKRYVPVYYYVFDKSILDDMEAAAPGAKANQFVSRITRKIVAFLKNKGLQQISPKQAKSLITRAGGRGTGMRGINPAKAIRILQKYKVVTPNDIKESRVYDRWKLISGINKKVI